MQSFQRPFMTWRTHGGRSGGGGVGGNVGHGPSLETCLGHGDTADFCGRVNVYHGSGWVSVLLVLLFPPRYLAIYPYSPLVCRFMKILVWSCGVTNTAGFGEHTQDRMKRSIPEHVRY